MTAPATPTPVRDTLNRVTDILEAAEQFAAVFDGEATRDAVSHMTSGEAEALANLLMAITDDSLAGVATMASWVAGDDEWEEHADTVRPWALGYPEEWAHEVSDWGGPSVDDVLTAARDLEERE